MVSNVAKKEGKKIECSNLVILASRIVVANYWKVK
jgi:hypothetical protein